MTAAETPRRPKTPPSNLGRYTLAAALVIVGLAAILERTGALVLRSHQYPALVLLIIGLGLLAGAVGGRARGLILAGVLVLPLAVAGGTVDVPFQGGFGERYYAPQQPADVQDEYRLAAGELHLDLTRLRWGPDPVRIEASVGMGDLLVTVPADVAIDFRGHAAVGELEFRGDEQRGIDIDMQTVDDAGDDASRLVIDAGTWMGSVHVTRGSFFGGGLE